MIADTRRLLRSSTNCCLRSHGAIPAHRRLDGSGKASQCRKALLALLAQGGCSKVRATGVMARGTQQASPRRPAGAKDQRGSTGDSNHGLQRSRVWELSWFQEPNCAGGEHCEQYHARHTEQPHLDIFLLSIVELFYDHSRDDRGNQ